MLGFNLLVVLSFCQGRPRYCCLKFDVVYHTMLLGPSSNLMAHLPTRREGLVHPKPNLVSSVKHLNIHNLLLALITILLVLDVHFKSDWTVDRDGILRERREHARGRILSNCGRICGSPCKSVGSSVRKILSPLYFLYDYGKIQTSLKNQFNSALMTSISLGCLCYYFFSQIFIFEIFVLQLSP